MVVDAARLGPDDTVLEVGAGDGALTSLLCGRAGSVVAAEADARLYAEARARLAGRGNLTLVLGDGFAVPRGFTAFVSNLPYSQSRRAIEWLARKEFDRAVVSVQEEFAGKLLEEDPRRRRAVSVLAAHAFRISRVGAIERSEFEPEPRVDTAVLLLEKRRAVPHAAVRALNLMFSRRRKAMWDGRRLEDLGAGEVMEIASRG